MAEFLPATNDVIPDLLRIHIDLITIRDGVVLQLIQRLDKLPLPRRVSIERLSLEATTYREVRASQINVP